MALANLAIQWLEARVAVLALMLFSGELRYRHLDLPREDRDIVGGRILSQLGKAPGISIAAGLWSGVMFLVARSCSLLMRALYIVAIFVAGLGDPVLCVNGLLTGAAPITSGGPAADEAGDVKAWRKANPGVLWLMGIVLVFLARSHLN